MSRLQKSVTGVGGFGRVCATTAPSSACPASLPLPLPLPQPTDPRLRVIGRQLESSPEDPSTLQDWATRLGVDVKTIQRLCAHELGMTFGPWRQQARLLRALEQLAHGDKVIDVALSLG